MKSSAVYESSLCTFVCKKTFSRLHSLMRGVGRIRDSYANRDEVEGLHNCREFSQRLECLYQAMQTQEKSFLLLL